LTPLGLGIGWRPQLALAIDQIEDLGFVELTAENYADPRRLPRHVTLLRERGVQVVVHGISLSLGGAEPIDASRARHLRALADVTEAPLVSEHIAFVRAGGREAGHLLPVARTESSLAVLTDNVHRAREILGDRPLALENISALFDWPAAADAMAESEFLSRLVEATGCLLLLDVANVYANARNLGGAPENLLDGIPLDRIAYVHLGGGHEHDGVYHDTHAGAIPPPVFGLLESLCQRTEVPGAMIERDDNFPDEAELRHELQSMREAMARGRLTRARHDATVSV
jgi:uncharacterized protein (UPF0276 family)